MHPVAIARVRDLGDCWIEKPFELQAAHQEIAALYRQVIAAGVIPISVGGDHSISLPISARLGRRTR
ncbi:MAG: arginase family protein [Acetobacteraceae bacterium]|nr:arginase family protein [Acetobacteraceae bacterium]